MGRVKSFLVLIISISLILISGCGDGDKPGIPDTGSSQATSETDTPDTTEETVIEPTENEPAEQPGDDDGVSGAEPSQDAPAFKAGSPVSAFTDEDIAYLGVNASGSEREIAESIKKWQEENMIYVSPELGFINASDAIRWNYFLPGIWPSRDLIYEHVKDGKIYGICHDYAIIYCSIASYYGLKTRVANTISKPSDSSDTPALPGMHIDEYNRNRPQLLKYGLKYSYDAVSSVAEETPTHYWAEVYLDGEWVVMDASQSSTGGNTVTEFISTGDYEITDWMSRDKTAELNKFAPAVAETDDLGQTGRAGSIGEIMQGIALAPYFDNARDAAEFVGASQYLSSADIAEMDEDKASYEECSGKNLYLVSYLICDGDGLSGQAWTDRYYETCGERLDTECAEDIISGN